MSELKATPGPWVASHRATTSSVKSLAYKSHKGPILVCSIPSAATGDREHTAHLIAAAPELYEALEQAKRELEEIALFDGGEPHNNPDINAALAKARGEQP